MTSHLHLPDTTIWITLSRRGAPEDLRNRIRQRLAENAIATNQVVRVEVLVGCRNEDEFRANEDRFGGLIELPIRQSTWDRAAQLGFSLRRNGVTVPLPDLVIAASAIEHEAIVIHADGHFDDIAKHSDLRVESYVEAGI